MWVKQRNLYLLSRAELPHREWGGVRGVRGCGCPPRCGRDHCSQEVCGVPVLRTRARSAPRALPPPHSLSPWYTLLPLAPPPPSWFPRARKSRGLVQSCPVGCDLRDASTNSPGPSARARLPGRLAARSCPQAVGATRGGGGGLHRCRGVCGGISGCPAAADSRGAHARGSAWRGPRFRSGVL